MPAAADHAELKQLERRFSEANARLKTLKAEQTDMNQRVQREQETLNTLRKQIDKLKQNNGRLVVSEHAILRYVERVMKLDLEEIRRKILPETLEEHIRTIGSGVFPTETHRIKVQNGVVITLLTDDEA